METTKCKKCGRIKYSEYSKCTCEDDSYTTTYTPIPDYSSPSTDWGSSSDSSSSSGADSGGGDFGGGGSGGEW